MTCIAGIADGKNVWIGGDSAGVDSGTWSLMVRSDEKVFRNGEYLFGFTSSFRMGDLLRYALEVPEMTTERSERAFLCTTFIDAVRKCLGTGGFRKTQDGVQEIGTFLLGYRGNLYHVGDDLQVGQAACGYDAVGCGHGIAKGSLFTTDNDIWKDKPGSRVVKALSAAAYFSAGVSAPFTVEAI